VEHLGWWVLGNAAMRRYDSAHNGMHSAASLDGEVVRRSMAVREAGQTCRDSRRSLLEQLKLETMALDMHSLVQRLDEGPVTLSQDVAEAEKEYEALGEASSCQSTSHGLPHLEKHQADHSQNELGTDLQWDWANTAAGATAAHRHRRGSQEEGAAHRHRT
jgi:hypothetical protein